jgi:hypothetical protein
MMGSCCEPVGSKERIKRERSSFRGACVQAPAHVSSRFDPAGQE